MSPDNGLARRIPAIRPRSRRRGRESARAGLLLDCAQVSWGVFAYPAIRERVILSRANRRDRVAIIRIAWRERFRRQSCSPRSAAERQADFQHRTQGHRSRRSEWSRDTRSGTSITIFSPRRRNLWVTDTLQWAPEARLAQPANPMWDSAASAFPVRSQLPFELVCPLR